MSCFNFLSMARDLHDSSLSRQSHYKIKTVGRPPHSAPTLTTMTFCIMGLFATTVSSTVMLSFAFFIAMVSLCCYAVCNYDECHCVIAPRRHIPKFDGRATILPTLYWNNISSDIRRRNLIRRQAQNIFFCK